LGFGDPQQLRKQWPQLAITKALGLKPEQDQHRQQGLHPLLSKGQRRRTAQAVRKKRWSKVRVLCRILLTRSRPAKWLAVRRLIANKGARTSGVDNTLWKSPQQFWEAGESLTRRGCRAQPLRRVYIVKRNGKLRPLGIPTLKDRAMQVLHALVLEPIAECRADPNSYGFRR